MHVTVNVYAILICMLYDTRHPLHLNIYEYDLQAGYNVSATCTC